MNGVPEIPGYRIEHQIGEGGMAVVYLAVQESLDRKVALKVMDPALADDRLLCARFLKEGRFVARMSDHPDIVTIYDIGCHHQFYYMAMEYMPGGSLKERIATGDDFERPLAVIRDVSKALKHAHERGIIHRDVKPGNILFRDDGSAVLTDFGIAKAEDSETQFTQVGFTVGSPAYMSLEQRLGTHIDARSDLYSLGVVLYEMLTGSKAFKAESPEGIAYAQENRPVPQLPAGLLPYQGIINRLLAKNPGDRFAGAQELINAIDAFSAGNPDDTSSGPAAAWTRGSGRATGNGPPRKDLRAYWLWGTGFAVVLVLVLVLVAAFNDFQGTTNHPGTMSGTDSAADAAEYSETAVSSEKQKIMRLLEIAEAHTAVGRLTEPPGANAYEAYTMVLEIDPANEQARRGLSRLERLAAEDPE